MFGQDNSKCVAKLAKKSEKVAAPFSDMLRDAQIHSNNMLLFEQDLQDQIDDLIAQKTKLGEERAKNDQLVDKLNRLFE